jgi:hypothetical protein
VIVVTGMHRSGTSLVCQLLGSVGVSFGDESDRFASDRWNPQGYFERRAVMDVNSRIVTGFPRTGSRFAAVMSKLVYASMPAAESIAARAEALRPQVASLASRYAACAIKDPRFCLTLRYWEAARPIERVVVCLRRPDVVVASLRRRDRLPRALGFRFWAYHAHALLSQLVPDRTVFVDVDRLAGGDAAEFERAMRFLGIETRRPAGDVVREVFRPESLDRGGEAAALPSAVQAPWTRLLELAEQRRTSIMAAPPVR